MIVKISAHYPIVVLWCCVVLCCVVLCCVVLCCVVWCGVVWCGVVWCGVVWCGVVWCGVVWCCVVLCCVVLCCVVLCCVVLCCCVVWRSHQRKRLSPLRTWVRLSPRTRVKSLSINALLKVVGFLDKGHGYSNWDKHSYTLKSPWLKFPGCNLKLTLFGVT